MEYVLASCGCAERDTWKDEEVRDTRPELDAEKKKDALLSRLKEKKEALAAAMDKCHVTQD